MRLSADQLEQYYTLGYVVIPCPFPTDLTQDCLRAVEKVVKDAKANSGDTMKNHFRLTSQIEGSYWSALDHSLPFLQIELHAEVIEIARQLIGEQDIYFRNGGINELAPGRGFLWHRDVENDGVENEYTEFMHYFSGADESSGCLRVVPGSQKGKIDELKAEVAARRAARGDEGRAEMEGPADVALDGEVSLELGPGNLLVRSSRIYHATWKNESAAGRLMHHWLFRGPEANNHRFRFDEYLSDELVAGLNEEQRQVLWLGREFEIDPTYAAERERELGRVRWSTVF